MSLLRDLPGLLRSIGPVAARALLSGQLFRPSCTLTPADPDILCEYDVGIPLVDGTRVTANIFRSRDASAREEPVPAIMCAHPYDNRLIPALGNTPLGGPPQQYRIIPQEGRPEFSELTSWEAPDPNYWVPAGYAVVNMNMPGYGSSGGSATLFSQEQADAFGQAIDWIGERPWCNGKVGLSGVSYLAISQYMVAAGQTPRGVPRCLAAISPWEGITDFYQHMFREGGVEELGFPVFWWHTEVKPVLNCSEDELVANEGHLPHRLSEAHPFYDEFWKNKVPRLEDIELPILVCASFSDQGLHTRGSFQVFRQARSTHKWVYTHRSLKWDAYYSKEALDTMRSFFDCFLKGDRQNGWLERAPVRLEVRSSRDVIHAVRDEREWPLARTEYRTLHLAAGGAGKKLSLLAEAPATPGELAYDAQRGSLRLSHVFTEDTELTGYATLRLWVEARANRPRPGELEDMAIFVGLEKLDAGAALVPFYGSVGNLRDLVARGLIQVSRRALDPAVSTRFEPVLLNDREEKLAPGEVVPVEIGLNPSSTYFSAGEAIRLVIAPREIIPSKPFRKSHACNRGTHVVHVGGDHDSVLRIPVVPRLS